MAVGSLSSCQVLVAHQLSASGGVELTSRQRLERRSPASLRSVSLFDLRGRFSVPTCRGPVTPSAAAVKDGPLGPPPAAARSVLDGGEHGVTLVQDGTSAPLAATARAGL